jgi:hypothetical protein
VSRRAWLLTAIAAAVVVLAAFFVHAHGWQDVSAGTDTTYCGIHL